MIQKQKNTKKTRKIPKQLVNSCMVNKNRNRISKLDCKNENRISKSQNRITKA